MQDLTNQTVLDPLETNGSLHVSPATPPYGDPYVPLHPRGTIDQTPCQTFRHSGWQPDRERVLRALCRTDQRQARISSFCQCGSHAYVLQNVKEPTEYRVAGSTCHDRFCQPCATERSRLIAANVLELVGTTRVRFITLTLRQTDIGLSPSIDRLLGGFKLLQRSKLWRKHVTGGVGFMEVKLNTETRLWNVHLHLLCTGTYILRDSLSDEWLKCTGDSFVVHIKLPKGPEHVITYVTKYASKPLNTSFSHDELALDEAVQALKGRRLCTTFGGWRSVLVRRGPDGDGWIRLGSLEHWLTRAIDGDREATCIVARLDCKAVTAVLENHPSSPRPPPPETPHVQLTLFPHLFGYPWGPRMVHPRSHS